MKEKEKTTSGVMDIYISNIYCAAQRAVFYEIPEFQYLHAKRLEGEALFTAEEKIRLERAQNLLDKLSGISSAVFGKISAPKVKSLSDEQLVTLCNLVRIKMLKQKSLSKMVKFSKFHTLMSKEFGISTDQKGWEGMQSLLAAFSSMYLNTSKGLGDFYYNKVTKKLASEKQAEEAVVASLKGIEHREIIPFWENGDYDEVVRICVQVMLEYESYVQEVPKEEISEIGCKFEYFDRTSREFSLHKTEKVTILNHEKLWQHAITNEQVLIIS